MAWGSHHASVRFARRDLLIVAASAIALSRGGALAQTGSPVMKVPLDGAGMPVSGVDGAGRPTGMIKAVLDIAAAELGWTFQYEIMPWNRTQLVVSNGTSDALCGRPTPERQKSILFSSGALFELDCNWVHYAADNPRADEIRQIRTIEQLRRFKIGIGLGNSWPNDYMVGWQTTEVPGVALLVSMVRARRVDLILESPTVLHYWERAKGAEKLASLRVELFPGGVVPFNFGLRRSFPDAARLVADFDAALLRLRRAGAIDRALAEFTA